VANYEVRIKESAAKELRDLPLKDKSRIIARIRGLSADPRPMGSEKLSGDEKYRLRQGNYRILYCVEDGSKSVTIVRIGHRRDVYRS
jgi:mRNA interferase RelE/StbE